MGGLEEGPESEGGEEADKTSDEGEGGEECGERDGKERREGAVGMGGFGEEARAQDEDGGRRGGQEGVCSEALKGGLGLGEDRGRPPPVRLWCLRRFLGLGGGGGERGSGGVDKGARRGGVVASGHRN